MDTLGPTERFIRAYNDIDSYMRKKLGADRNERFVAVVDRFWEKRSLLDGKDELRALAGLRNVIVHTTEQFFVPSSYAVERIERIMREMLQPEKLGERFEKDVECLNADDDLRSALKRICERDYSQFPVFDGKRFVGLLTENGVARWLALYLVRNGSLAGFADQKVRMALGQEETPRNFCFARSDDPVDKLAYLFGRDPEVEAVLIAETGKRSEPLLGIVTRWDLVQLMSSLDRKWVNGEARSQHIPESGRFEPDSTFGSVGEDLPKPTEPAADRRRNSSRAGE